jgi:hypothetical protein
MMNVQDLLTLFRNMADDEAKPYFWSDDVFYLYLTDAINKYCEKGKAIRDHTSSLTTLEYTPDYPWVALDEKVLKLISAYDDATKTKLRVLDWETYEDRGTDQPSADYNAFLSISRYPDQTGSVYSVITGMEEDKLRLVNIPVVSGTLSLIIDRYPLYPISENNQDIEGVPDTDRMCLLDWVMHRAYNHQDSELFDPNKSALSRAMFLAEMQEVDSRDMKKKHRPNVASGYGGI